MRLVGAARFYTNASDLPVPAGAGSRAQTRSLRTYGPHRVVCGARSDSGRLTRKQPSNCHTATALKVASFLFAVIQLERDRAVTANWNKASVSRLKDALSACLRKVRAGQSVIVYDRDGPIDRIDRIEEGVGSNDRLALLAVRGITRPAAGALSVKRRRQPLSKPRLHWAHPLDALRGGERPALMRCVCADRCWPKSRLGR